MPHDELFSVKQVASRIAEYRGVSEAQVARVIRHLAGQDVIAPKFQGGSGPTAPNLWDEAGVHRIAILVELNRLGLSDALVRAASRYLNNFVGVEADGIGDPGRDGIHRSDRLWKILPRLREGYSYYFHLYLVPDYFQQPGNVLGGTFSESSDGGSPHSFNCTTISVNLQPVLPLRQG